MREIEVGLVAWSGARRDVEIDRRDTEDSCMMEAI
jgi:hypothetical protein